jgi:hypothetical protein
VDTQESAETVAATTTACSSLDSFDAATSYDKGSNKSSSPPPSGSGTSTDGFSKRPCVDTQPDVLVSYLEAASRAGYGYAGSGRANLGYGLVIAAANAISIMIEMALAATQSSSGTPDEFRLSIWGLRDAVTKTPAERISRFRELRLRIQFAQAGRRATPPMTALSPDCTRSLLALFQRIERLLVQLSAPMGTPGSVQATMAIQRLLVALRRTEASLLLRLHW